VNQSIQLLQVQIYLKKIDDQKTVTTKHPVQADLPSSASSGGFVIRLIDYRHL
jgi:hypothetical protein